ncbi:hypothetical protein FQK07_01675 [Synechococcus sp. BSF8S]|nr:hypothetical protein [Synechococcus sp. BSF8S]MBC1262588.1 hypothetical protein [Synechococcus sp. BSA11S]
MASSPSAAFLRLRAFIAERKAHEQPHPGPGHRPPDPGKRTDVPSGQDQQPGGNSAQQMTLDEISILAEHHASVVVCDGGDCFV